MSLIWSKIQVAFNDGAGSITGAGWLNHITIKDLLDLAGIESANRMVVKAIAAETWSCYHSNDGKDLARNHVRSILFTNNKTATAKTTRLARTWQITVPLRGGDTFVTHSANVWNQLVMLWSHRRRRLQRRRHQTWQVSLHFIQDPAGLDLLPAARGVFPAGLGASPAGRWASPRERGLSPSRSCPSGNRLLRVEPF
jgi:hypothetical protein